MIDRSRISSSYGPQRFARGVRVTFGLLTRREKMWACFLLVSMNVHALLNIVGVASIVPFVHLMLTPDPFEGDGRVAQILRRIGLTDINTALVVTGAAIVALVVARSVYSLLHTRWQNLFCAYAELRVAKEFLRRVAAAPYDWLATQNASILRDIIRGHVGEWSRISLRTTLQLISDIVFLGFTFVFLVVASPVAGLIAGAAAVLLALALLRLCRPFVMRYAEQKRVSARLASVSVTEAVMGGRDVRMSNAGELLVGTFERDQHDYNMADVYGREWQLVPRLGIEVVGFFALIGISLGAVWSGAPRAEVGTLLALYAVIAVRVIPVVSQAATSFATISGALPAVIELDDMLTRLPNRPISTGASDDRFARWANIALSGVSYTYPGAAAPAIGPVDLVLERGASLGIVGASGAGKSTMIDLLVGLLEPTEGDLLVDGARIDSKVVDAWRARIGYVAQSPFMLDATLGENIEFGTPAVADRDARCRAAAEAAGLGALLASMPKGLDTPIGDRGLQLSGGQRQRVAIARALYRNADLLVLDEATSALDSVTEQEIISAIDELKGKLTLVIVAHRLSTVIRCDEIVVLEAGRVVARGPHGRLLSESPAYRRLVEAQSITQDGAVGVAAQ